jgi:hypothetical protein
MPVSKVQEKVTTDEELRQIKLGDLGEYLGLCRSGRRCRDVPPRPPTPRSENPCIDTPLRTAALIWVVADPRARVTRSFGGARTRGSDIP